jgi:hypothetical protein
MKNIINQGTKFPKKIKKNKISAAEFTACDVIKADEICIAHL